MGVALDIALVTVLGVTVLEEQALEEPALEVRVACAEGSCINISQLKWDERDPGYSWIRSQKLCETAQKLYTRGLDQVGGRHLVVNVQTSAPPKNVMDFKHE